MGSYITCYSEKKDKDGKYHSADYLEKLSYQSYNLFGFLCNRRNYAMIPGISCESRGLPDDASDELKKYYEDDSECFTNSVSWVTVEELNQYNYNRLYFNQRDKIVETVRETLRERYFKALEHINAEGIDRVVFWID